MTNELKAKLNLRWDLTSLRFTRSDSEVVLSDRGVAIATPKEEK